MAAQARKGEISLPDRRNPKNDDASVLANLSQSPIVVRGKQAANDAAFISRKLIRSTGKAAWIAGTSFLILVVPLIIAMDREAQLNEIDLQQANILGTSGAPPK